MVPTMIAQIYKDAEYKRNIEIILYNGRIEFGG
jgi:hypothetical protein